MSGFGQEPCQAGCGSGGQGYMTMEHMRQSWKFVGRGSVAGLARRGAALMVLGVLGVSGMVAAPAAAQAEATPAATPARPAAAPARSAPGGGVRAPSSRPAVAPGPSAPRQSVRSVVSTTPATPPRTDRTPGLERENRVDRRLVPSNGVNRAPGGGVRAPGGGVRAPGAGAGSGIKPGSAPGPIVGPRYPVYPGYPGNSCDHGVGCTCYWYPIYGYPFFGGWFGYGYNYGYGAWRSIPRDYRQWAVVGPVNQEFQGEPAEPEPLTTYETAVYWMMEGDAEQAVEWFRAHLDENPDDLVAMREYAAAMLEVNRTLDAVAVMAYAYDLAPGLSSRAMDAGLWGGSPLRLRRSVVRAVRAAHQAGTGHAWLTVAVLMQAEGRDAVALRMVDRAMELGLNPAIGDRLRAELDRR